MEVAKSSAASGGVVRRGAERARRQRGSNEGASCGRSEIGWERERQEAAGGGHSARQHPAPADEESACSTASSTARPCLTCFERFNLESTTVAGVESVVDHPLLYIQVRRLHLRAAVLPLRHGHAWRDAVLSVRNMVPTLTSR
jgi:hypothetical protein